MATKIRLKRIGRRNRPFYRMVVMDARNRRDGAAIEELGWYNPLDSNMQFELNNERIIHWLSEGAEPTTAAKKILRHSGISHKWHLMKQGLDKTDIDKEMEKWKMNRKDVLEMRIEKADKKEKKSKQNDDKKRDSLTDEDASDSDIEDAKDIEEGEKSASNEEE